MLVDNQQIIICLSRLFASIGRESLLLDHLILVVPNIALVVTLLHEPHIQTSPLECFVVYYYHIILILMTITFKAVSLCRNVALCQCALLSHYLIRKCRVCGTSIIILYLFDDKWWFIERSGT